MLSNSSKYAIKAVLYLAMHSNKDNKIMVKDLAATINVPYAYIAKLLQQLAKEHIISSTRGPKGGFYLNETNKNQSIITVINSIDDEKKQTSCLLGLEKCNDDTPCPLHPILSAFRTKTLKSLKEKTIKDLALSIEEGNTFLPL